MSVYRRANTTRIPTNSQKDRPDFNHPFQLEHSPNTNQSTKPSDSSSKQLYPNMKNEIFCSSLQAEGADHALYFSHIDNSDETKDSSISSSQNSKMKFSRQVRHVRGGNSSRNIEKPKSSNVEKNFGHLSKHPRAKPRSIRRDVPKATRSDKTFHLKFNPRNRGTHSSFKEMSQTVEKNS